MCRCLHAKHIDDRMKVRRVEARSDAHVLGAANRLYRTLLSVPLSLCVRCAVSAALCVCSHRGDENDKLPTVVSTHLGVVVPARIAAML